MIPVTLVVLAAGCGSTPSVSSVSSGAGEANPVTRSEQVRATAGKEPSVVGPISAEVVSWKVEKPQLDSFDGPKPADDEMLVVVVKFSTDDETVKKDAMPPLIAVYTASDEFGNTYSIRNRFLTPAGDVGVKPITKGNPVTRTILIEKPIAKATRIDLDLSGFMCDLDDKRYFRFTIPLK